MAPVLYFFCILFTLCIVCLAEVISLRGPNPAAHVQDLVQRTPLKPYPFITTSTSGGHDQSSGIDSDLLDIVLVASVDGKLHALNRTSGDILWSMSSFSSSSISSFTTALGPLVKTSHANYDPEGMDEDNQELYIVEPQSGDIYVKPTPDSPLQRFPFSMSELVDMSPFSFADSEDRRVFVGRKETSLLLVELETGKVKATLNSECPWVPFEDFPREEQIDLDELEDDLPHHKPRSTEVFIGRTDYSLKIFTGSRSRNSLSNRPVQNLSFSTYGPNNQDIILQDTYKRTKDDTYVQSLPTGRIISFKTQNERNRNNDNLLWANHFPNPIVAVFDVLQKPLTRQGQQSAYVLLQPRPGLQQMFPSMSVETAMKSLPNLESAYVGMVEESGSLFAMSPSLFPLLAFGDETQHASRGIDPSWKEEEDVPTNVDDITRARKLREYEDRRARETTRCLSSDGFDTRCLVGIHKLEGGTGEGAESRMRRLLDGSPTAEGREELSTKYATPEPRENPENATLSGWPSATAYVLPFLNVQSPFSFAVSAAWIAALAAVVFSIGKQKGSQAILANNLKPSGPTTTVTDGHVPPPIDQPVPVPEEVEVVTVNMPDVPPTPTPATPKPNGKAVPDVTAEAGDDSDNEDEFKEDENAATAKKKSNRRGKRGKKKKQQSGSSQEESLKTGNGSAPEPEQQSPSLIIAKAEPPVATVPSLIVSESILGFGSHGTVVYQGSLQGRAVAVKRLLQDFVTLASREVAILQESDDHPNVIRYYYQEAQGNFLYIALELCPASLADIIETPDRESLREIVATFSPKRALRQITSGLKHLHALKLVHRDIKPQNILVSAPKSGSGGSAHRMLISDFGLCKKLEVDQTSFLPTATGALAAGTVGWRAPEILRGEVKLDDINDDHSINSSRGSTGTATGSTSGKPYRLTKSVDIFALGCLFYYTLTNGGHPYGDRFEREGNIWKDAKSLEGLERFGEEGSEATDLIQAMLDPEAYKRPDTTTCLLHPYFWEPGRRLNFLQDASDRFEIMCRDPKDAHLLALEKSAFGVVGNDWQSRLDRTFLETLGKFRKYDGKSVQDLLRALRNKKHHYQDLPDNVKRHVGSMPDGFLQYFTRRYPKLFMHVHGVIGETSLRYESMFKPYFELSD